MAYDVFMQIDGIKGESTDSEHRDWIDVLSVSSLHPIQPPKLPVSKAAPSSVEKSSFSITKAIDKASPKLYEALHNGTHIPKVIIELYRSASGGSKQMYLTIKMNQVLISNISTPRQSPQTGGLGTVVTPVLMTESVSFNYGNIEWEYT